MLETTEGGLEKLAEVTTWRDSTLFSEAERLALEYAERITYTDRKVDDALVDELKKHYSDAQIVELTAGLALFMGFSKIAIVLGAVPESMPVLVVPTPE